MSKIRIVAISYKGRRDLLGWRGSTKAKQGKSCSDCGEMHAVLLQTTLELLEIEPSRSVDEDLPVHVEDG